MKSIEEFEKDITERFLADNKPSEDTTRHPTSEEMFFIREMAMLSHFVHRALVGVTQKLESIEQKVTQAIAENKPPTWRQ